MNTETNNTESTMTAQEIAVFLLENKKWNTMYAKNSPRIIELVKEESYEMYVDARAKEFDAFKDAAAAEAFCEAVIKAYTAANCDIQIGDNVHVVSLNKTGYVVAIHEDICKSYSVKFSDGQQWNIVEKNAELVRA